MPGLEPAKLDESQRSAHSRHHPRLNTISRHNVIVFCSSGLCEHLPRYRTERTCKGPPETPQERAGEGKDTRSLSSI
jgi:hypothetical protein